MVSAPPPQHYFSHSCAVRPACGGAAGLRALGARRGRTTAAPPIARATTTSVWSGSHLFLRSNQQWFFATQSLGGSWELPLRLRNLLFCCASVFFYGSRVVVPELKNKRRGIVYFCLCKGAPINQSSSRSLVLFFQDSEIGAIFISSFVVDRFAPAMVPSSAPSLFALWEEFCLALPATGCGCASLFFYVWKFST